MNILQTVAAADIEMNKMSLNKDGAWMKVSPKVRIELMLEMGQSLKIMKHGYVNEEVGGYKLLVDRDPAAQDYIQFGVEGDDKAKMIARLGSTDFLWRLR